jgi:hypothetical protein
MTKPATVRYGAALAPRVGSLLSSGSPRSRELLASGGRFRVYGIRQPSPGGTCRQLPETPTDVMSTTLSMRTTAVQVTR